MPPVESDNQNFSSNEGGIERGGVGGAGENPWRDDLGEIYGPPGDKPGNVNGPSGDSRPDDKSQKEQLGPGQGGEGRWVEAGGQSPEIKGTQASAAADNGNGKPEETKPANSDKPSEGNVNGQASDNNSPAQKGKDVLEGASSGNKEKLNGFGEAVKEGVDAFKKFADEKPAMGDMKDHQKAEKEGIHQNLPQRTPDGSEKSGPAPEKDENTSALAQPKDMAGYKQPEMQMQENGMQPVGGYEPIEKIDGVSSPKDQKAGDAGAQQQGSEAKDATDPSVPSRGIEHGYPSTDAHKLAGGRDNSYKIEQATMGADGKPEIPSSRSMKNDAEAGQKFGMTDDMKNLLGNAMKKGWENVDLAKSKR